MKTLIRLIVGFGILIVITKSTLINTEDGMSDESSSLLNNDSREELTNTLEDQLDLVEHKMKQAENLRSSFSKKSIKPIVHYGYTLDINIDTFKSTRYCHYNEICKNRYKHYFECLCPKNTLCIGQGSLFEAKCSKNLMPYIWLQSIEESQVNNQRSLKSK